MMSKHSGPTNSSCQCHHSMRGPSILTTSRMIYASHTPEPKPLAFHITPHVPSALCQLSTMRSPQAARHALAACSEIRHMLYTHMPQAFNLVLPHTPSPPIIVSRLWNSNLLQGLCSMSSHCALMFQGSSHPRKHYDSTRVLPRRICHGGVVAPNIVLASSDIQGSWGSYLRVLLLSVCWSCPFFQYRTTLEPGHQSSNPVEPFLFVYSHKEWNSQLE